MGGTLFRWVSTLSLYPLFTMPAQCLIATAHISFFHVSRNQCHMEEAEHPEIHLIANSNNEFWGLNWMCCLKTHVLIYSCYTALYTVLLGKYKPSFFIHWLLRVESFNKSYRFTGFNCSIPWLIMTYMFSKVAQLLYHPWQWHIISLVPNVFLKTRVP